MPSVKRKASTSSIAKSSKLTTKSKGVAHLSVGEENSDLEEDEEEDDFDDGEDLMARALNGDDEGDDEEDESEDEEDEAVDESSADEEDEDVDMEEEEEEDADEEAQSQPRKRGLHAIPTSNEMQMLKNTSELFKSNIFKLKVSFWACEISLLS